MFIKNQVFLCLYYIYIYIDIYIYEAQGNVLGCLQGNVLSYRQVNYSLSSLQSRRRNLCGVQSYANCSRHPPAPADVWSPGVWQDWKRNPFLASGLHAPVLCVSSLSCSLCVGIPTWPLSGGEASLHTALQGLGSVLGQFVSQESTIQKTTSVQLIALTCKCTHLQMGVNSGLGITELFLVFSSFFQLPHCSMFWTCFFIIWC